MLHHHHSPHLDVNSTGFAIVRHTLHGIINLLVLLSQFSIVRYIFSFALLNVHNNHFRERLGNYRKHETHI